MRKVKLIWEFFGDDALPTAVHHSKHLHEFCTREQIDLFECGTEEENDFSIAFLIVKEERMIMVRDALRPKRGEWVDD